MKRYLSHLALGAILTSAARVVLGQSAPGVTPEEIRIGNIVPYTGPAAVFATVGKTLDAYFKKVNDEGGIHGRKLVLISSDDGYSPPRTLEQARKLVERDGVFLITGVTGTAHNAVIQRYLNDRGVPHLFPQSGASRWNNAAQYKWTVPSLGRADQEVEAAAYARYIRQQHPGSRIGVLFQNDDYGKDFLKGFKQGLGDNGKMLIAEKGYEPSEPTVDVQVDALRSAGADTLAIFALPKFCAQAIRRAVDTGWNPRMVVGVVCSSVENVMKPAGIEKAKGVMSGLLIKDPSDPRLADDPEVRDFKAFMARYYPSGSLDVLAASTYMAGHSLVEALKRAGKQPTREKVLEAVTSLKDWREPLLMDGLLSNLTASDYTSLRTIPIGSFNGTGWDVVASAQATGK